ncbi:MAG: DUF4349 domain-containing protein [Anaeromicrobium sp.]|jgi:hypothetical protein|uniref:DUF4349 domain-containing protein n=1 Tax=Anaeromicrobium sp. TaxID=1929132 RepID=UPI0025F35166|nr:DUF4349 domain-containing protein [Anaeromicrobium sp.]MCT4594923.1 DUF4349 domain-containing protein [Anaeromicrobium sp.]
MKCVEFEEMISLYIDNMLDEKQNEEVRKHMDLCSECRELYEALQFNVNMCEELPMIELPENFHKELYEKLVEAKEETDFEPVKESKVIKLRDRFKRRWKVYSSVAALFIVLLGSMANMGSLDKGEMMEESIESVPEMSMDRAQSAPNLMMAGEPEMAKTEMKVKERGMDDKSYGVLHEGQSRVNPVAIENQKIIKNTYMSISVSDFNGVYDNINNKTKELMGYMEFSNIYDIHDNLKAGNFTIRIPKANSEEMIEFTKNLGKVNNIESNAQNVTNQYYDTENKIKNKKVQEERLRSIMEKATKVEDILQIERELNRVRMEIDSLEGTIKNWDNGVAYSTITLEVREMKNKENKIEPIDKTLWQRAKEGFIGSINNIVNKIEYLLVKVISNIPNLILVGTIVGGVYLLYRRFKK